MAEEAKPVETIALIELARCETLGQRAAWAARFAARASRAEAALLYLADPVQPDVLCVGAWGEETTRRLRRTVGRDTGLARDLLRDRVPRLLRGGEAAAADPLLEGLPRDAAAYLGAPLLEGKNVLGLLALAFRQPPSDIALIGLESFLPEAAAALDTGLRADRKTAGHLQAIERLTSLYDLTKAFGSTIDLAELSVIIARKAADFTSAEVASFWTLDAAAGEVALAATAINENYDIEGAPGAVGGAVVGDVLAGRTTIRRNELPEDDAVRTADPDFPVRSLLAAPLVEDETPVGAIVAVNKRGRHPVFTEADEELLADLAKQAVAALRNARQFEAEKKVAELDALLAVSREITSTLDLDKVMRAIVNASAALVTYDRAAIAILSRGQLRIGAVSGTVEVDRKDPAVKRTEELLEWVFWGGQNVAVTRQEDGTIETDRPETEEKFNAFFEASGRNAFYGVLLEDEEGKLGVLGFECDEPLTFDEGTRDLLQILVNQATVAVRNAQLYQKVPLPGFLRPLAERTRKLSGVALDRRRRWALGAAAVLLFLVLVPWNIRVDGTARAVPGRKIPVTATVEGIVATVEHREGDLVRAGDVVATLRDDVYRAAAAEARAAEQIAEADVARHRAEGNAGASGQAAARRDEMRARAAWAEERLAGTQLRAPEAGIVLTPRLDERVGQLLAAGAELAVLAETSALLVEVAIPEDDAARLAAGQPVSVKMNSYPTRTFRGSVSRVGAVVHAEAGERFVIAETRVENPESLLKPGMLGKAKVSTGRRPLLVALLRRPARWVAAKLWPLLP
ncbi:MAG TPA: efflux RND transporter periplasmic adaptor subunit [Thermoanaerobaculia bacterium]|nr:efflux RND transporter periplasmic adaptor subunit [Thermoanaerobaculia bacterium]